MSSAAAAPNPTPMVQGADIPDFRGHLALRLCYMTPGVLASARPDSKNDGGFEPPQRTKLIPLADVQPLKRFINVKAYKQSDPLAMEFITWLSQFPDAPNVQPLRVSKQINIMIVGKKKKFVWTWA